MLMGIGTMPIGFAQKINQTVKEGLAKGTLAIDPVTNEVVPSANAALPMGYANTPTAPAAASTPSVAMLAQAGGLKTGPQWGKVIAIGGAGIAGLLIVGQLLRRR